MSAASGALTSGRWMLRPNSVPRTASGGTVTGCPAAGVLRLRPISVARFSGYITSSRLAGPESASVTAAPPSVTAGPVSIWIGCESSRVGSDEFASTTTSVTPVSGPGGLSSDRSFLSTSATFWSSTTVGPECSPRASSSSISRGRVVLVDAHGGRFILPNAAKNLSGHGAILTDIAATNTHRGLRRLMYAATR